MGMMGQEGFSFTFDPDACRGCPGHCCRGVSGTVWVSPVEMERISVFLQMNVVDFMGRYLRRVENRWSLRERVVADGLECVFFDAAKAGCGIYPVRPSGCRSYPFWDHFKVDPRQVIGECPGIRKKIC